MPYQQTVERSAYVLNTRLQLVASAEHTEVPRRGRGAFILGDPELDDAGAPRGDMLWLAAEPAELYLVPLVVDGHLVAPYSSRPLLGHQTPPRGRTECIFILLPVSGRSMASNSLA